MNEDCCVGVLKKERLVERPISTVGLEKNGRYEVGVG